MQARPGDGVAIDGRQLNIGGRAVQVCGAEIHYFRLPRESWRDRVQKARDGGMNTVSSYIPWYWHEPQEGVFDLVGKSDAARDLCGFLELTREMGMWFVARPGPFVNSELRCGGQPEWLYRRHPETLSRRGDGRTVTGRPVSAEGSAGYRRFVRRWYDAVVPTIAEFDAFAGGHVILFQPDNELSASWSYGLLNSLYDPEIVADVWPAWLRETYGDLDALGRRYGIEARTWRDAPPPAAFPRNDAERARCWDWLAFKRWFFADWGRELAAWARELGIRVPVVFNEPVAGFYGHGDHAGFGAVQKAAGLQGFTACHTYADRLMDLDGCMGTALGIELAKSSPWGGPPMTVELNCGWTIERMSRSGINWDPLLRLCLGRGISGYVVYPYAAATVSLADVIDGPEYWAPSCIDAEGRTHTGWRATARYNRFVQGWENELTQAETEPEVLIAYSPGQRILDFLGAPSAATQAREEGGPVPGGDRFDAEPALDLGAGVSGHDWLDGYEGVSKQTLVATANVWRRVKESGILLSRLNVGFGLLDLTHPNREPGAGLLIVACTGYLEREAVDFVLSHLAAGGRCLFFPTIPVADPTGRPDDRVGRLLGVRPTGRVRPAGAAPVDYGARLLDTATGPYPVPGWIWTHAFPEEADVFARFAERDAGAAMGCGAGRAAVCGTDALFTNRASLQFWRHVLEGPCGVRPRVRLEGAYRQALWRGGLQGGFLSVIDVSGVEGSSRVTLRGASPRERGVSLHLEMALHEARTLVLGVRVAGRRLDSATSEVVPLDGGRSRLEVTGAAGTPGRMSFDRPTAVRLDGRRLASRPEDEAHVIEYVHGGSPSVAEIGQ